MGDEVSIQYFVMEVEGGGDTSETRFRFVLEVYGRGG